jgi:NTE family protein
MKKSKLGLVLAGGGARGIAHIGLLKVLERERIRPAFIAGTSMGAIIGAAYATGMDVNILEKAAIDVTRPHNMIRMVHLTQPSRGLIDSDKLRAFLAGLIPEYLEFDQLKIPLAVCATDLITGKAIGLREGKILPAIMASCALPGVFKPVHIGPYRLVDGGVVNNLPVDLAYQLGAEKVVAVDVQQNARNTPVWEEEYNKPVYSLSMPTNLHYIARSEIIMAGRITEFNLRIYPPDLLIEIPVSNDVTSLTGYNKAEEIIRVGEETTLANLDRIKALLE